MNAFIEFRYQTGANLDIERLAQSRTLHMEYMKIEIQSHVAMVCYAITSYLKQGIGVDHQHCQVLTEKKCWSISSKVLWNLGQQST